MNRGQRNSSRRQARALYRVFCLAIFASLALMITALPSQAAFFDYGDFSGTDVDYIDVEEETGSELVPLFGAPEISGNLLDFDPQGFFAETANGGADIIDSQLNFEICAKANKTINNVKLNEAGDFVLQGAGTGGTFVSVSAPTTITIKEVDGVPIAPFIDIVTNMDFVPVSVPDGFYDLPTFGPVNGQQWSGSLMVDITQELIAQNVPFNFGATKVELFLNNSLTAISETGTIARIAKKDFSGFTITTNIPEPTTCSMALLGLLAVVSAGRRSRS